MSQDGTFLEERAERAAQAARQADRDKAMHAWFGRNQDHAERLVRFDVWLRRELAERLDWAWAGSAKEKRIEQCRIQIDSMVMDLWRRGWMLDGRRLADRITGMLDAIGKAQRGGQVRDFWPYFKASVDRYVGLNAEEIREEALDAGAAVGDVFKQLLKGAPEAPSLPELVAQRHQETLREKTNRLARQKGRHEAEKSQLRLL
jgi:hypothetical protein